MLNIPFIAILFSLIAFDPVPYQRDKKAIPQGEPWLQMIPLKLGAFERIAFQAPQPGNDGAAYYKKGNSMIYLSFIKLKDDKEVLEYMSVARGDILSETADVRDVELEGKHLYVLYKQFNKAFFAWNRGLYYFDVMIEGDVTEMDEFMKLFPY